MDRGRSLRAGRCGGALALALAVAAAACGGGSGTRDVSGTVVVLLPRSLDRVAGEVSRAFEEKYPDVTVDLTTGTPRELRGRAGTGDGDVYLDKRGVMRRVLSKNKTAADPKDIASTEAQVITAKGNPKKIEGVKIFDVSTAKTVACAPKAPCGGIARRVLAKAKIKSKPDAFTASSQELVERIASGDADAGILLASAIDSSRKRVDGVAIADDVSVRVVYQASVLKDSDAASAFVGFLESATAQAIFRSAGYEP